MDARKQPRNIIVRIAKHHRKTDIPAAKLRKLIKSVCARFNISRATVGIAIVDDAEMSKLNEKFLNHRGSTDCLSFDLSDSDAEKEFEIVANGELAQREAALRGHSPEAELALYITHGLLHNLGFDDSTGVKAKHMHRTENEILELLGYGPVYNRDAI